MTNLLYSPACYRATAIPALPPPEQEAQGFFDTALGWGNYANLDSVTEVESQLEDEEHLRYEEQEKNRRKAGVYCDAERWSFERVSKIPHLLFVMKLMSLFFASMPWSILISIDFDSDFIAPVATLALCIYCWVLYGGEKNTQICLLLFLCGSLTAAYIAWNQGALWGYWHEQTAFWFGVFLAFMAIIGCDLLLALYARFYQHDGSGFFRREGLVRVGRRFRSPFVAPFYEFDPVMQLQVLPHGGHDYVLWLYHRYTGFKVCLGRTVHNLGLDQQNLMAFWDTLQRYMDVEQPLPDLPVLEQSRHQDPVTAAHDAASGRPPRYWRDLDIKAWKRNVRPGLRERLAKYPWQQQPCILQARIDPALSIEAYYRSQEAKGIHATPKADDFDDIRRP